MHRLSIYSPVRKWKKGDPVGLASVYLSLGSYQERDGHILLSAQLMADQEIEEVVIQLKAEIDEFGRKARKELKTIRKKMRETF